jgi:hypothetical protein
MKRRHVLYLLASIPFVFADQIGIAPRIINGTPAAKGTIELRFLRVNIDSQYSDLLNFLSFLKIRTPGSCL